MKKADTLKKQAINSRGIENLGYNIISLRRKKNLSQVQLACRIGTANTFLCDIEKGRSTPSLFTVWKIANALDVKISSLFDY